MGNLEKLLAKKKTKNCENSCDDIVYSISNFIFWKNYIKINLFIFKIYKSYWETFHKLLIMIYEKKMFFFSKYMLIAHLEPDWVEDH